ncbi:MAG: lactoylglutathione lyase [Culicoidibacterales bacterium]
MANKMLHACLRVMDLEKSVTFYTEGLGLIETNRLDYPEHAFTLVYLAFEPGGYEIELTYNYNPEKPYEIGTGFSHLAVGVDDLVALHAQHTSLNYEVTPLKGLPGQAPNYYFVTDPDGYKIEVIQNR